MMESPELTSLVPDIITVVFSVHTVYIMQTEKLQRLSFKLKKFNSNEYFWDTSADMAELIALGELVLSRLS